MHLSDMSGRAVLHLHILPKRPGEAKQNCTWTVRLNISSRVQGWSLRNRVLDFRACSGPDRGAKDRDRDFACLSDMSGRAVLHLHILPKRPGEAKQNCTWTVRLNISSRVQGWSLRNRLLDFRACSGPDRGAKDRDRDFACLSDMSGRAVLHLHILPKRPGEAKQNCTWTVRLNISSRVQGWSLRNRLLDFRACSGPDCGADPKWQRIVTEESQAFQTCRRELFFPFTSSEKDLPNYNKHSVGTELASSQHSSALLKVGRELAF